MFCRLRPAGFRADLCAWFAGLSVLLAEERRYCGGVHECVFLITFSLFFMFLCLSVSQQLATYCLAHALNSVYNYAKRRNLVQPRDWLAVVTLTISIAMMIHSSRDSGFVMRLLYGKSLPHEVTEVPQQKVQQLEQKL